MPPIEELNQLIRLRERGVITEVEFVQKVRTYLRGFEYCSRHDKDILDALIGLRTSDTISDADFWMLLYYDYLPLCFSQQEALEALSSHSDERIRAVVPWFQSARRVEEQNRDFDHVRRTSSLQPGIRLRLFGGYTSAYASPWWLNGKQYHDATFVGFAHDRVGGVPKALVEFDEELHLTGADGSEHRGRYAILNNTGAGCSYSQPLAPRWTQPKEETIAVYLFSTLPEDADAFSSCSSPNTAIETHALYEIVASEVTRTPAPHWQVAKEMSQVIDDLDDRRTADGAAHRLCVLLAQTPCLLFTVLPTLIQKLVRGGRIGAIIRKLLCDRGTPALRALVASLPCRDPRLRGQVAHAIGQFGAEAREALPALEPLLRDELQVRVQVAMAIWRIDGRTSEMAWIIFEGLHDAELSSEAGNCLREMGPDVEKVVLALVELLSRGKEPWERASAAVALGGMGLDAVLAIPALISAIEDANEEVSWSAFGALRELRALARLGELILQEFDDKASQT